MVLLARIKGLHAGGWGCLSAVEVYEIATSGDQTEGVGDGVSRLRCVGVCVGVCWLVLDVVVVDERLTDC